MLMCMLLSVRNNTVWHTEQTYLQHHPIAVNVLEPCSCSSVVVLYVIQNEDYPRREERRTVGQQFEQLTLKFANKYGSSHQGLCREEGQL